MDADYDVRQTDYFIIKKKFIISVDVYELWNMHYPCLQI